MTTQEWCQSLTEMMQGFVRADGRSGAIDEQAWSWLTRRMHYMQGDFTQAETYRRLDETAERAIRAPGRLRPMHLFYMAVADRFFGPVIEQLGGAGLIDNRRALGDGSSSKSRSATTLPRPQALNAEILKVLTEDQIYRIDHFLGKETVRTSWRSASPTASSSRCGIATTSTTCRSPRPKTVGVEHRGGFYEPTGALRDMVPNHLFQLLGMIAMEPPISFDAEAVRGKKTEVFAGGPADLGREDDVVRGQYGAGQRARQESAGPTATSPMSRRTRAPKPTSRSSWHRQLALGRVPFYLRTGKRLPGAAHRDRGAVQASRRSACSGTRRSSSCPEHPHAAHPTGGGHRAAFQRQAARARDRASAASTMDFSYGTFSAQRRAWATRR